MALDVSSVKHQQKVLASHSHARQVDVIANLDAAELGRNSRPSAQQESPLQDKEAGADSVGDGKGRDIHTPTPSEATCAPGSTECTEDRRLSVLRIAKDTDMVCWGSLLEWKRVSTQHRWLVGQNLRGKRGWNLLGIRGSSILRVQMGFLRVALMLCHAIRHIPRSKPEPSPSSLTN